MNRNPGVPQIQGRGLHLHWVGFKRSPVRASTFSATCLTFEARLLLVTVFSTALMTLSGSRECLTFLERFSAVLSGGHVQ